MYIHIFRWYLEEEYLVFEDSIMPSAILFGQSIPLKSYRNYNVYHPYYIVLLLWILIGSYVSQMYEANLLANLVKVDLEKQPQTLEVPYTDCTKYP